MGGVLEKSYPVQQLRTSWRKKTKNGKYGKRKSGMLILRFRSFFDSSEEFLNPKQNRSLNLSSKQKRNKCTIHNSYNNRLLSLTCLTIPQFLTLTLLLIFLTLSLQFIMQSQPFIRLESTRMPIRVRTRQPTLELRTKSKPNITWTQMRLLWHGSLGRLVP